MKTLIAALTLSLSASVALASGLPISGAYGGKWACDTYKAAGINGVLNDSGERDATDGDRLILSDRVVEPGRSCAIKSEKNYFVADCSSYANTVLFKKVSRNVIFYGEAHMGTNYHRCP